MIEIKCKNCGSFSKNSDYCEGCGALISYEKIRAKELEELQRKKAEKIRKTSLIEYLENHEHSVVRFLGLMLKIIWVPFMAIGAFIAWLVAAIAS